MRENAKSVLMNQRSPESQKKIVQKHKTEDTLDTFQIDPRVLSDALLAPRVDEEEINILPVFLVLQNSASSLCLAIFIANVQITVGAESLTLIRSEHMTIHDQISEFQSNKSSTPIFINN